MPSRLSLAALLAAALAAYGDEAVRSDGSHVTGRLALDRERFVFRVSDRDEPVANLDRVRFATPAPSSSPILLWHQVRLAHGEVLTAEVRSLDDKALHVRTPWAEDLAIPRTAIDRVSLAGGRVVRFDAFSAGLGSWTKTGEPRVFEGELTFDKAGQAIESAVKPGVAAGRVGVAFRLASTINRRVSLELGFVRGGQSAAVRVELIGPGERYAVTASDQPEYVGKLKRESGSHRMTAEFDGGRLAIFVDDLVLWNRDAGPGELRSVKLVSEGDGTEPGVVTGVLVARTEPAGEPRPWADLTADAVRSPDGDETFGTLRAVGPAGVTLEVKGKRLSLGWSDVAEFTFRRERLVETATAGEHVRVQLRAADESHDLLDGAVKAFGDKTLVLVHPVLGEVLLPRDRVEELRFLFHGRRIPVDTTPHHLGTKPAFGFAVLKPEGLKLVRKMTVAEPAAGFVVIDAAHVRRAGTPIEVRVNGETIGELNRLADKTEPIVRSYRLPITADRLRRGDNEIEVRLRPGNRPVTGVDLRAIWLELAEKN
jgi:hypothetical protein